MALKDQIVGTPKQMIADAPKQTRRGRLVPHDYANMFPTISEKELKDLAEDIRENGQQTPIVLYGNKILDGRNRYQAIMDLDGVEPTTTQFTGNEAEALAFVVSANLKRRHLTDQQRKTIAADIAYQRVQLGLDKPRDAKPDRMGGKSKSLETKGVEFSGIPENSPTEGGFTAQKGKYRGGRSAKSAIPDSAVEAASEQMQVSSRETRAALTIKERGIPALYEMVKAEQVSVQAAALVCEIPKLAQEAVVAQGPDAVKAEAARLRKAAKGEKEGKLAKAAAQPPASQEPAQESNRAAQAQTNSFVAADLERAILLLAGAREENVPDVVALFRTRMGHVQSARIFLGFMIEWESDHPAT